MSTRTDSARSLRPLVLPAVFPVRGVSFHAGAVAHVRSGDRVRVVFDVNNPFDASACAIVHDAGLLGYVPRELSSRLRLTGSSWEGTIVDVLAGETCTGLRIRVLPSDTIDPCDERQTTSPLTSTGLAEESDERTEPSQTGDSGRKDDGQRSDGVADPLNVHALSGRLLGVLVGRFDGRVRVLSDGRTVDYPERLVVVGTPGFRP